MTCYRIRHLWPPSVAEWPHVLQESKEAYGWGIQSTKAQRPPKDTSISIRITLRRQWTPLRRLLKGWHRN